jgi:hypothetical protein
MWRPVNTGFGWMPPAMKVSSFAAFSLAKPTTAAYAPGTGTGIWTLSRATISSEAYGTRERITSRSRASLQSEGVRLQKSSRWSSRKMESWQPILWSVIIGALQNKDPRRGRHPATDKVRDRSGNLVIPEYEAPLGWAEMGDRITIPRIKPKASGFGHACY